MLARTPLRDVLHTVLPAAKLGIREWERRGLIAFVEWVEAQECYAPKRIINFHMQTACEIEINDRFCGTVVCIGGFVGLMHDMSHAEIGHYVMHETASGPLGELYYLPRYYPVEYGDITPAMAAEVTRHFLLTGIVDWLLVVPPKAA